VRDVLRFLTRSAARSFGQLPRHCNLCGHEGRFFAHGVPLRFDARCIRCGSLDRHRLLALADEQHAFFRGMTVVHFAPEPAVKRYILSCEPASYVSADLFRAADRKENIEAMSFDPGSIDTLVCSHVLEHVDDIAALTSMRRVLKTGGRAVLMFPVCEGYGETYEAPAEQLSNVEREVRFGQFDHVRFYGSDVRDRIASAGFRVDEYTAVEPYVRRHGLVRGEKVFIATAS
jgi:SAM-dependent methyltransferase